MPALRQLRATTPTLLIPLTLLITITAPLMERALVLTASLILGCLLLAVLADTALPRLQARHRARERQPGRSVLEMALHLSPVILLTLAFPIATRRISSVDVAGVPLTSLLLASSLTVPWLSQAACLPMYRAIGHLMQERDMGKVQRRLCEVWPLTFLQTLPAIAIFAVPVQLVMHWPSKALLAYLALCIVHLAFAQGLIAANVGRRRWHWALAWATYAAVLIIAPAAWFLPALAGLATQLIALRQDLPAMRHLVALDKVDVAGDLLRGLLLGAVLWSDKLFFFLRTRGDDDFPVSTVFWALLPAILAYNYYFVRLAPIFDRSVLDLRNVMENGSYRRLTQRSGSLSSTVDATLVRTGLVGAALGLVVTFAFLQEAPSLARLVAWVSVASWFFVITTVACYKLDYVGRRVQAQVYGAIHLAVCAGVFTLMRSGTSTYIVLTLLELPVCLLALHACRLSWRSSEYVLFWRHATAW